MEKVRDEESEPDIVHCLLIKMMRHCLRLYPELDESYGSF